MNVSKLRAKMVEKDMNVDGLAAIVGIDRSSMYRKLNNLEKITIGEAKKIKSALNLTDDEATIIFLL
jgi:predicted transcriptional regulator